MHARIRNPNETYTYWPTDELMNTTTPWGTLQINPMKYDIAFLTNSSITLTYQNTSNFYQTPNRVIVNKSEENVPGINLDDWF